MVPWRDELKMPPDVYTDFAGYYYFHIIPLEMDSYTCEQCTRMSRRVSTNIEHSEEKILAEW